MIESELLPVKPLAVSLEEASRLLPVSVHTWRKYLRKGLVRGIHVGRRVLIPLSELERVAREGISNDGR